jgi:integrase/recombinase XerD
MKSIDVSVSLFSQQVSTYLQHYRARGLRYCGVEQVLGRLARHLEEATSSQFDHVSYESWCRSLDLNNPNTRRKSQQIVRKFCLFCQRRDPDVFVPGVETFAKSRPPKRPVIVEPDDIARMLQVAGTWRPGPNSPLHAEVARIATVLLYTSGLRLGELLRLCIEDVEDAGAVLRIRESKFHRTRLVPLSRSAQHELRRYLRIRVAATPESPDRGPLLYNHSRRHFYGYSPEGISCMMHRLFAAAHVCDVNGHRPRVHDLRHSFAIQALIRAYRNEGDPQATLPKLSLYMGHASIESTLHYLHLVPAVAALASRRFEQYFGSIVAGEQS